MKIGTKSVLYGAHCFFIHPWFVAAGWLKMYGTKRVNDPYLEEISIFHPLLWLAFLVHDVGYLGKPNMDGEEGESHPSVGANILKFFGGQKWYDFSYYHSRFLAKRNETPYSMLCVADKLSIALEPSWLYLPRVIATGEISEYMDLARDENSKYGKERRLAVDYQNRTEWQIRMSSYCKDWAYEHSDGKQDNWTSNN